MINKEEILKEIREKYTFEVLKHGDVEKIEETADVITDTFLGVQIGSAFIQEPMMKSSHMPKEAFHSYMVDCLSEVTKDGLTVVAIDKSTNKVVGATVSEFYKPGQEKETVVLEGEQSAMNVVNSATDTLISEFMEDLAVRGIEVKEKQYIHRFLTGVRLELNKKFIGEELSKLMEETAKEKGAEVLFSFASNFRSQKMLSSLLGYTLATNNDGKPITFVYENDEFFKQIPKEIAIEGQLLIKSLK